MLSQEDSDLDDMKDIPVFKPILRAIIRSQMKHLMKQLSRHGGEEAMVLTASVSDGAFDCLGSAVTEGFLDDKEDFREQFLDHCMKGVADGDDTEKNDKSKGKGSTGKSPRNSKRQTGTAKGAKKRPGATVSGAKPAKRSTVSEEGEMGETIGSFDDTKMENSDSDDTLSLDLGVGKKGQRERMKEFSESGELNETEQPGPSIDPNEVLEVKVEASLDEDEVPELDDNADPDWDADEDAAGAAEAADADYEPPKAEVKKERKKKTPGTEKTPGTRRKTVEPIVLCKFCGHTFRRSSTGLARLRRHELQHEGKLPPLLCKYCGRSYTNESGLRHHEKKHTGTEPFKCPTCSAGFCSRYHLNRHMNAHEGVRNFECNRCSKRFITALELRRHQAYESGTNPFKCDQCQKSYGSRRELSDHLLKHSGQRTYLCKLCPKAYFCNKDLRRHVKKEHPISQAEPADKDF